MKMVAAFFHFLLSKFVALLFSLFLMNWQHIQSDVITVVSFFGYWAVVYAILTGLAASAILVNMAELKNKADDLD